MVNFLLTHAMFVIFGVVLYAFMVHSKSMLQKWNMVIFAKIVHYLTLPCVFILTFIMVGGGAESVLPPNQMNNENAGIVRFLLVVMDAIIAYFAGMIVWSMASILSKGNKVN